ncbi:hypothetical protein GCM10027038_14780 [Arthrobacter bambusae]
MPEIARYGAHCNSLLGEELNHLDLCRRLWLPAPDDGDIYYRGAQCTQRIGATDEFDGCGRLIFKKANDPLCPRIRQKPAKTKTKARTAADPPDGVFHRRKC